MEIIKRQASQMIFSVVMPSFNQVAYIEKSILSILGQKGNFFLDFIVVDGGSTDGTPQKLAGLESAFLSSVTSSIVLEGLAFVIGDVPCSIRCRGVSFRWVSEPDSGQANAINKGIALSRGDCFCWLNSDDILLENALQKAAFALQKHAIVFGGAIAVDADGKEMWRQLPVKANLETLLLKREGLPQPSVFFRKELLRKYGTLREDLHYYLDHELWMRFAVNGIRFYHVNEIFSVQVYHPGSKSCQGDTLFEKFRPEESAVREEYFHKRSYRIVVVKNASAIRSAAGKGGRQIRDTVSIGINVFYKGGRWIAKRAILFFNRK